MLSLTQHLDGFRKSQQIRICILFLPKLAQINLERKRIEMEFLNNYTMQSVYFCNLKRELGCILACVGVIGEEIINKCHPEFISGSYQRRMDKFSVSRLCEEHRDEANQNKFFLDCFTFVRNDKEKVGVECQ